MSSDTERLGWAASRLGAITTSGQRPCTRCGITISRSNRPGLCRDCTAFNRPHQQPCETCGGHLDRQNASGYCLTCIRNRKDHR